MRRMCLVPTLLMCSTKAFRCPTYSSVGTCWRPLQCTGQVTWKNGVRLPACLGHLPALGSLLLETPDASPPRNGSAQVG